MVYIFLLIRLIFHTEKLHAMPLSNLSFIKFSAVNSMRFLSCEEGPRSRCYGRSAALRLLVQPCDEDERKMMLFFFIFPSNGAPVE
jgi:hypothetical protein